MLFCDKISHKLFVISVKIKLCIPGSLREGEASKSPTSCYRRPYGVGGTYMCYMEFIITQGYIIKTQIRNT